MKQSKKFLFVLVLLVIVISSISVRCAYIQSSRKIGYVYFYNFKPESDEAWQELAKLYSEKTGVEVKVETRTIGNYREFLDERLKSKLISRFLSIWLHRETHSCATVTIHICTASSVHEEFCYFGICVQWVVKKDGFSVIGILS